MSFTEGMENVCYLDPGSLWPKNIVWVFKYSIWLESMGPDLHKNPFPTTALHWSKAFSFIDRELQAEAGRTWNGIRGGEKRKRDRERERERERASERERCNYTGKIRKVYFSHRDKVFCWRGEQLNMGVGGERRQRGMNRFIYFFPPY